ncbi:MAG: PAS domain S-box protein [Myxococcales bacterium]|nr:PAS domain S-box protein [Myxococcales bacterium]
MANESDIRDRLLSLEEENRRLHSELQYFRESFENQLEGIGLVDLEERFILANPAAHEIFGVPPGTLQGRRLHEFIDSETLARIKEQTAERQDGRSSVYEMDIVRPDGQRRTILVSAVPRRDPEGGVSGSYGIFRDVTEQRRMERALADESSFINAILDTADALVVVLDTTARVVRFNPACQRITGYSFEEMRGRPIWELIPPEERPAVRQVFANLSEKTIPNTFKNYWLTRSGGRRLIAWSNTVLKDAEGGVRWVVGTGIDITEFRAAQERAEAEFLKLSAILSGMEEGVAFVDETGSIGEINDFLCRMFCKTSEELVGQPLRELDQLCGGGGDEFTAFFERFRAEPTGTPAVAQRSFQGSEIIMRLQPICQGGRFFGMVINFIDVSELVRARRQAEEASRLKSEFLANVSHEIRTPLSGIIGLTGLLQESKLSKEMREWTDLILSSAKSLLSVIDDILDFSRIESGRFEIGEEEFEVARMVEDLRARFLPRAVEKGLRFDSEIEPNVPARLLGDGTRLRQVLSNLLDNAVKFTDRGTIRVAVSSPTRGPAEGHYQVRFEVADSGIGIRAERLSQIFEAFVQGDGSSTRRHGGTGLGLAISSRLVAALGGKLEVTSQEGSGSRFSFTLPFKDPIGGRILDEAGLTERTGGDRALVRELFGIFEESCCRTTTEVRQAILRRQSEPLRRLAHTLKGAAANLGAREVAEVLSRLEQAGRAENWEEAGRLMGALHPTLDRFRARMQEYLVSRN